MDLTAETEKEREEELIFLRECRDIGKNLTLRNRQPLSKHHACLHMYAHVRILSRHVLPQGFHIEVDTNVAKVVSSLIAFDIDGLKADFTKHSVYLI